MSSRRGYQVLGDTGEALLGNASSSNPAVSGGPGGGTEADIENPPNLLGAGSVLPTSSSSGMSGVAQTTSSEPPRYPVRILDTTGKEHAIDAESGNKTIGVIKMKVAEVSGIQPLQQRLIFAGKMMQDDQTLESYGVQPNMVIHLFARPTPPQGSGLAGAASGTSSSTLRGGDGTGTTTAGPGTHLNPFGTVPTFGDPELIRSTHSVKLFSSCLVAICTMQMLLLMLKLMASWQQQGGNAPASDAGGEDGGNSKLQQDDQNFEDSSAMFFLQVLLNTLGLYVGLIGVRSANTLQLQSAKAYFYGLIVVGTLWLSLRIIWAINSVNLGYDADLGPQPPGSNGTDASGGGDDDSNPNPSDNEIQQMDKGELIYMVSLSVMIYTMVWSVCFLRASQFYNLLRRANGLDP